jgi:hypothetical protein
MSEHRNDIYHSSHSNSRGKHNQATVAAMTRRTESQLARFREIDELSRKVAPTREERELQQAARGALLKNLGIDESAVSRLRESRQQRLRDLVATREFPHAPYSHPSLEDKHDPPGSLEMWWARTDGWGNAPGVSMSWQDDGIHFSGGVHVDDDDLQKYSITIVAQFALGSDRIPDSARGMVHSAPIANVFGLVYAICKDFSLWDAFDDQWAKCWLNTRQTVWVTFPGVNLPIFGDRLPWGSNAESRSIVFLDSMGVLQSYLPGRIALPPVDFNLAQQISDVEIDLEFSFDMQIEGGDSNLSFGEDRDWPSNVVETLQWKLIPEG